jgi:hypothetical protein
MSVNNNGHVGTDFAAQSAAGALAVGVQVASGVIAAHVKVLSHDDQVERADRGTQSATLAPRFVNHDPALGFAHASTLSLPMLSAIITYVGQNSVKIRS